MSFSAEDHALMARALVLAANGRDEVSMEEAYSYQRQADIY